MKKMKRKIYGFFILLFLIGSGGCASSENYTTAINGWRGANAAALIQHWGYPQRILHLANGNQLYVYRQSPVDAMPVSGDLVVTKGMFNGDNYYALQCTTWFEINRHHRVISTDFRGNNCVGSGAARY